MVHISGKTIRRAQYLKLLGEPEYKKLMRLRNAVEGIPSVLRRKYRVDEMPVRGYVRSKLWYFLRVGAINARMVLGWAAEQAILLLIMLFTANLHFSRLKIAREASH